MKNCLLILKNKKTKFFAERNFVKLMNANGYYLEKYAYLAYDEAADIAREIKTAFDCYDNLFVICPSVMFNSLTSLISRIFGGVFDERGYLNGEKSAFVLLDDSTEKLSFVNAVQILNFKYGVKTLNTYIRGVGASYKQILNAVEKCANINEDINFNVSENYGDFLIEIVYLENTPKTAVDTAVRVLLQELDQYVYALENISLEERLFQLLKLRRMKISVAESFTGGGVGKRLTGVSGVSEVYFEGLNTYSNDAKSLRLNVDELTLKQYGAVSKQTAYEMAEGLLKSGNCDVAISTTGIAGPKSDNTQKPVGLCYIGVGVGKDVFVYEFNFKGDRKQITETAINHALFLAYKHLK